MTSAYRYFTATGRARAAGEMPDSPASPAAPSGRPTLEQLLAFEEAHPKPGQRKHEAIRRELGITEARYFQLLGRLIQTDEALQVNPATTHRLRRMEQQRADERARRVAR